MSLSRLRLSLSLALLLGGLISQGWTATGARSGEWAHESSDLAPDPRVVWGRLDNGFRYALLPHRGVPGRVSMRFIVLAGSLDERPDERGIAHFTEHMAFHGTRDFRWEDMVGFFQRLGIEYGSDVNAHTTFDNTTYELEFRDNDPKLLGEGLRLFRNFADGVEFSPAGIEHERGVVMSELRNHDNVAGKAREASFPVIFKGLRFPDRAPGGTIESLRSFDRAKFLEFYHRCYRPDLMTLVVVGDIQPDSFEQMVREQFSPLVKPDQPIPEREEGRLDTRRELRAGFFRVTDVGSVEAQIASVQQAPEEDSRERRSEDERRSFAMMLLGKRLQTSVPDAGAADAAYDSILGYNLAIASIYLSEKDWKQGIAMADEVVRSTYERGFEKREIEPLKHRLLVLAGHMLEQAPTLDPAMLAGDLAASITEHTVYVGWENQWKWRQEDLQAITQKSLQESFRNAWDLDRMAFHLAGDINLEKGAADILADIHRYRRGGLRQLRPDTRRESVFKLPHWGNPTEVVETREVPELEATLMRFGNNVRLNFVHSQQEPGLVEILVRVGNGLLDMPGDRPALKEFGLQTLLASGTTHFTVDQMSNLIEDHLLNFSFDAADLDAFSFRGVAATEKIDVFLALVTDFLDHPRFQTYAHRMQKLKAFIGRGASALGLAEGMRVLNDHLFRGDARFMGGTPNDYIGLSTIDVRDWLEEPLSHGYVEVTIVGDIAKDAAIASVARTLGTLEPRAATKELRTPPRPLRIAARPGFERIEFIGEQNLGLVVGTWPVIGVASERDHAALHLLTKILEIRIRQEIRDNLGLAYSPSAEYSAYEGFPDFGLVQTTIDCSPSEANRVAELVEQIAAEVARDGVTEGEFIGSRGILESKLRYGFQTNEFLLDILARAQEKPKSVADAIALKEGLTDKITRDEVNAWAAKVLPASNSRTAAIVPKPFIGIFQTGG